MKKTLVLFLIVALAATVNSQTSDKKWGVGLGAGIYGPFKTDYTGTMPELYFSRYISPKFDVLLKGNLGLWRTKLVSDLDLVNVLVDFRYKLTDETRNFRPYLFAGPGYLADNTGTGINFDLGLGAKYYLNPILAVYGQAGYINGIKVAGETENLWKATVGVEVDFGKSKDSDRDGVADKNDKCPNTPAGIGVDENGCPKDMDGDGVADDMDDCPTVAGLTSMKGCPDADKDGIADKDDACPDVAGTKAMKGCPDADGDGITDQADKCPNTKKGYKVDASGCPLDQDKDGIVDAEDDCPTVAGIKENKGCPAKVTAIPDNKKEIKAEEIVLQNIAIPSIHFASNKSYITEYSQDILNKLVVMLNENMDYNVNVYGYADSQGTNKLNIRLSKQRVKSAIDYLVSKGINKNRITEQKAFGEAKPIATNDTPEGRLQNRRVEFEIFKMK